MAVSVKFGVLFCGRRHRKSLSISGQYQSPNFSETAKWRTGAAGAFSAKAVLRFDDATGELQESNGSWD